MTNIADRELIIERDVMVPTRDGVALCTDIYRPDTPDRLPVLVMRTPYGKAGIGPRYNADKIATTGYVVVVQEVRGTFGSEGVYANTGIDGYDGYDCVEWAAAQPWSTGRVGMYGASAMGATQWEAAQQAPPHLVAIAPEVIAWDSSHRTGFMLEPLAMFALNMGRTELMKQRAQWEPQAFEERLAGLEAAMADPSDYLRRLPLTDQPLLEGIADFYFERLTEPVNVVQAEIDYSKILVPAFVVSGWFDFTLSGSLNQFHGMRSRGGTASAREGSRLLVGNWYHGVHGAEPQDQPEGWVDVAGGASARVLVAQPEWLAWMQPYLHGEQPTEDPARKVRVFTMGSDQWQDLPALPPSDAVEQRWYLHSAGNAVSSRGDGTLSTIEPGDEPADTFSYDPLDPVVTPGDAKGGVLDQRPVLGRDDVLVYLTDPLSEGVEVTGPVSVTLTVATSAKDTDFTAKLLDVRPDGVVQNVADNLLRMRFRNGPTEELLEPGQEYSITIDLVAVSTFFRPGHQIGLEVSSSNFPLWDRNPNTGADLHSGPETKPAAQTVYHDQTRPSYVTLPVRSNR